MPDTYNIVYNNVGAGKETEWREGFTPAYSYESGMPVILPVGSDMVKTTEPLDFGGWYLDEAFTDGPISEIPASAIKDYSLWAQWVRYTPNAEEQSDEIDILTSGIYPYDYEGHNPIRVLFGVRPPKTKTGRPIGTIEVRDANTGAFLYDYTDMQQLKVDNANIKRLVIGNYVISAHTSINPPLAGIEDDSLLIEYMGE